MINPEDETVIDSRTSFTIEECVARMLGWMQGTVRLASPKTDQWGVLPEQLPHLYQLEYPLDIHLHHLRERARNELLDAVESGLADDVIWEKDDAVNFWTAESEKATKYQSALIQELNKGGGSALKIDDQLTSLNDGNVHVTLESLDKWAKQFGEKEKPAPKIRQRRYDALSSELEAILKEMDRPTASKVMAALRKKIGDPTTCILASVGDGLKWDDNYGDPKILTIANLNERIRYWRKHHKNPE